MKKILSFVIILLTLLTNTLSVVVAVPTDGRASPWTREKAAQLAKSTLFNADATIINTLFAAGSASAALDILFPSIN